MTIMTIMMIMTNRVRDYLTSKSCFTFDLGRGYKYKWFTNLYYISDILLNVHIQWETIEGS